MAPYSPPKPCRHPGCSETVKGERFCPEHQTTHNRYIRSKRTDKAESKFYTSAAWRNLRRMKLNRNPLCESCEKEGNTTTATIVHHDAEIRQGGDWLPDIDELTSMCLPCHSRWHGWHT